MDRDPGGSRRLSQPERNLCRRVLKPMTGLLGVVAIGMVAVSARRIETKRGSLARLEVPRRLGRARFCRGWPVYVRALRSWPVVSVSQPPPLS